MKNAKCLLFVPLYDERIFQNDRYLRSAEKTNGIILDLEDSLPESLKEFGRGLIPKALDYFKPLKTEIYFRVNAEESLLIDDLKIIAKVGLSSIIPTKVDSVEQFEIFLKDKNIALYPIIETAKGVINVESILSFSKVKGCLFGPEDLSVDIGSEPTTRNMLYAASKVIITAKALDIPVLGFCGSFSFLESRLEKEFLEVLNVSREIGFDGAYATRLSQIEPINSVFRLSSQKRKELEEILAIQTNNSVFAFAGKLIGPPMVKRIKKMLHRR